MAVPKKNNLGITFLEAINNNIETDKKVNNIFDKTTY